MVKVPCWVHHLKMITSERSSGAAPPNLSGWCRCWALLRQCLQQAQPCHRPQCGAVNPCQR